jgi:hypothetical protein
MCFAALVLDASVQGVPIFILTERHAAGKAAAIQILLLPLRHQKALLPFSTPAETRCRGYIAPFVQTSPEEPST